MAGKRKELSPAQRVALHKVKEARGAFRNAQAELEARIRSEVERELRDLDMTVALAVRRAHELEVPLSRIGVEGLGTRDYKTVAGILGRTERMVSQLGGVTTTVEPFTWKDREAGTVTVQFPDFPTTAWEAVDYPPILAGVVREDSTSRSGWAVVDDPGTVKTPLGDVPGWLTWELAIPAGESASSLTALLSDWVGENR